MTVPGPWSSYAARTFAANAQVVLGPAERPSPQVVGPPRLRTVTPAGVDAAARWAACGKGRVTATAADAGVASRALAITSMRLRPRWTEAVATKTPLATVAGRPWTSTTAFAGETVPRTVT